MRSDWLEYEDAGVGLRASYPPDWHRARTSLTPNLLDPKEILALGTYPLRPGGERCANFPVRAIEDLGPEDAFIAVYERRPPWPKRGYPPRESVAFSLESGTGRFCVPEPRARLDEWISFSDSGRAFYLLVAVGPSATTETRAEVRRIVKGLVFAAG